jgi:hypothetical protein
MSDDELSAIELTAERLARQRAIDAAELPWLADWVEGLQRLAQIQEKHPYLVLRVLVQLAQNDMEQVPRAVRRSEAWAALLASWVDSVRQAEPKPPAGRRTEAELREWLWTLVRYKRQGVVAAVTPSAAKPAGWDTPPAQGYGVQTKFIVWHAGDSSIGVPADRAEITMHCEERDLQKAKDCIARVFLQFWSTARGVQVTTDDEEQERLRKAVAKL